MNDLLTERVKQFITIENNRRESWLKSCCNILYPTLTLENIAKVVKTIGLTIYEDLDSGIQYLAFSKDFVQEQYINYIANFYKEGYTLPTFKDGSLLKIRYYYD